MSHCPQCPVPRGIPCVNEADPVVCSAIGAGDAQFLREAIDRLAGDPDPRCTDPSGSDIMTSSRVRGQGQLAGVGDMRVDLIRSCPHRVPAPVNEELPPWGVSLKATCGDGRGAVPGVVTLRDCLDCAGGEGPVGGRYPFRKDVLIRAALTSWTGYGQIGEWLGRGLESLGLGVGFADTGTDPRYLPRNPWVAERAVPARADAAWSILLAPPYDPNPPGRVVRFTMWESSRISPAAAEGLNAAELVCVPCEANRRWFVDSGVASPIAVVPMGISPDEGYRDDGTPPPREICRFGMAARMAHGGIRKGLNEGMEAFVAAFPPSVADVELVLKVWPDCLAQLRIPQDRRIRVVTTPMRPAEMAAWYRTLTALLVPSKGEGWGLHTHQAMAIGRPVIAVPWGGTAEFWDEHCGWSLEYDLAPAGEFYTGQGEWAVPRHDSMVGRLRQVYAGRDDAATRGRRAAFRAAEFTWDRTARHLCRALVDAGLIQMGDGTRRSGEGRDATRPVNPGQRLRVIPSSLDDDATEVTSNGGKRPIPEAAGIMRVEPEKNGDGEAGISDVSHNPIPVAAPRGTGVVLEIPIVIMTTSRPESYLDRTLASLAAPRPITLMAGTPEMDYLADHRDNPRLQIVAPDPGEYARVAGIGVHRHAAWNYWRCLGVGEGRRHLLVFEDDVRFAAGWEQRLARVVGRIEQDHADYILSLYYSYRREDDKGTGFIAYSRERFFGTQGVLFAGGTSAGFRSYLYERGVEDWTMPYDLLLRDYTIDRGIPLLATMPSLVQHIGVVTTGQSADFHTSPCFADDISTGREDRRASR